MQDYKFKFPSPLITRMVPPLVPYKKVVEEANDTTYTWLETVPENIGTEKMPLVIKLHGGGTDGEFAHNATAWARLAVQQGFIAVFPSGRTNRGWAVEPETVDDEIAYLNHIIDRVIEKYPIDETRIYDGYVHGRYDVACVLMQMRKQACGACEFLRADVPRTRRIAQTAACAACNADTRRG